MIKLVSVFSRHGKIRLLKYYVKKSYVTKAVLQKEVIQPILARRLDMCQVLQWRGDLVIYRK